MDALKNVKISEHLHKQIKKISSETGINVSKLVELGVIKIIDMYSNGAFDNIKSEYLKIRRNGSFTRN